ncbi:MAG: nucleotidyltransferase family protein [Armatimonadetes bacterium]|nr:nucleotidyltransferase family protein [Armatimonadota bacterium]
MPPAIVLAGGGPEPRLAPGLPNKAFLTMGGRPLVVRVTDALRACTAVERILVVGPPDPLAVLLGNAVEIVQDQDGMMDNVTAAIARLPAVPRVLTIASDLPLLTGDAVGHFLGLCTGDYSFYYPIVPQAAIERRFPEARKTYVRLTDGVFCGGSVLLFDPAVLDRVRALVERMMAARKKPWLLAQLFGWTTVMKFAAGTLSIAQMEERAFEVTGIRAKAVVFDGPEVALDVDAERPENLKALLRALEAPGAAEG